jgi:hypothetical protein
MGDYETVQTKELTCWLDASLAALNSGHIDKSNHRVKETPAITAVVGNTSWRLKLTADMKVAELRTSDAWVTQEDVPRQNKE